MIKAKDIMTTSVICVGRHTPAHEAADLLIEHEITGMPVVEDDMTLVGIITEKDLLRLFHALEDENGRVVEDFMTAPAIFFQENECLEDICDFLVANDFRRVPVTSESKKGRLVGLVSRRDVLRSIIKMHHTETIG
jgi:CBS domain-containing protein